MISGKNVDLRRIDVSDAEFVLSLRIDPEINQYLSPVDNDLEKQREWIKRCMADPEQWYFIIQSKKQQPVGTVRIYDIQGKSFCWGSWIVIPEARRYASFESAVLLYHYAFFELGFESTHMDVRKKNESVIRFHIRFGATITHENELDVFLTFNKEIFVQKQATYAASIDKISQKQREPS